MLWGMLGKLGNVGILGMVIHLGKVGWLTPLGRVKPRGTLGNLGRVPGISVVASGGPEEEEDVMKQEV